MRIVITGATGFIGSYLATLFLREGAEVFALSRPDSPNLKALPVHENLHIVPWSMDRAGDCVSQIGSADAFFHFAWSLPFCEGSRKEPSEPDSDHDFLPSHLTRGFFPGVLA